MSQGFPPVITKVFEVRFPYNPIHLLCMQQFHSFLHKLLDITSRVKACMHNNLINEVYMEILPSLIVQFPWSTYLSLVPSITRTTLTLHKRILLLCFIKYVGFDCTCIINSFCTSTSKQTDRKPQCWINLQKKSLSFSR